MTDDRPVVYVDTGNLAEQADVAWTALAAWANADPLRPRLVLREGALMRFDEEDDLQEYDADSLMDDLSRAANFVRAPRGGSPAPTYPPLQVVRALLKRGSSAYAGARRVSRVTDVPVLGPDGAVVWEPGLHESGITYRPAPGLGDTAEYVWHVDRADDVEAARDVLLEELLGDFDFQDQASRANALALAILPFVRDFIGDHPTPLHAVIGPQPGSGKTTLVQACLAPGCGAVGLSSEPRSDDELRKRITSRLLRGRQVVAFDNLSQGQRLSSPTLAAALTAPRWTDRVLGQSRDVDLPVRCAWVVTGNNVETSSELADRTCLIRLNPRGGVPARQRPAGQFRHADLVGWAIENRARLVGAALTLIDHWMRGPTVMRPDGSFYRRSEPERGRVRSERSMGSFNRWAEVVGGVLAASNAPGFLSNRDQLLEAVDPEQRDAETFLAAPHEHYGDKQFTARDLTALGSPLRDQLPDGVGDGPGAAGGVGTWLSNHRDATYGGLVLRRYDLRSRVRAYSVELVDEAGEAGEAVSS